MRVDLGGGAPAREEVGKEESEDRPSCGLSKWHLNPREAGQQSDQSDVHCVKMELA